MISLHTVDVRTVSNTVSGVTTILGIATYNGTPAKSFQFGQQVPPNAEIGTEAAIERRCLGQALDQFLLWVQNGKPNI